MTKNTGRLAKKTALITAAGQGIGRATAELFAAEGAQVIAADINDSALAEIGNLANIQPVKLDVTDPGAVARVVADIGPLDILFNCAGYVHNGTILECEEADWDFSFNLNVKAMYRLVRATLPAMLQRFAFYLKQRIYQLAEAVFVKQTRSAEWSIQFKRKAL